MYKPNFVLIGKPYNPDEVWMHEMEARLENLMEQNNMLRDALNKKRIMKAIEKSYRAYQVREAIDTGIEIIKTAVVVGGTIGLTRLITKKISKM